MGLLAGRLSYAVILLDACLSALLIALPRLAVRVVVRHQRRSRDDSFRRTIVVGAGAAGGMIVRELAENAQLGMVPVAMVAMPACAAIGVSTSSSSALQK